LDAERLRQAIHAQAAAQGFDLCRFTGAQLPELAGARLEEAVGADFHGTMEWLAATLPRRRDPRAMWSEARSAIVLGMNYGPDADPLENLDRKDRATISVYARNRDYHDVMKGKLKHLAQKLAAMTGSQVKVFVDTAPLMEKPLAAQAGLGWQGKHTNLVSREFGSWLFLGVILTDGVLEPDPPEDDHCGTCRACLEICPTNAFPSPYRLDARRCISYLTIEHKGPVPLEFRAAMGNRIYGCDDCLAVCPWNKFASTAREAKLKARDDLAAPPLAELAALDEASFRARFSGSPVKRIGRNRFIRNVLIAIGNSGQPGLLACALPHLRDPDPLVRGAAVWAMSRLAGRDEVVEIRQGLPPETDGTVAAEWRMALENDA
jgi:epoxyqueuosine reductase